jgi:hypothetical protein
MDLKDIASVSGKSGLYKIVKPTRTGVILETIDEHKIKIIANANNRVSLLKEISVYTNGEESSKPLENIFEKIHEKFGTKLTVDPRSSPKELSTFLEEVIPDYDKEKVYASDIKKIVNWYGTLIHHYPERFIKTEDTEKKAESVSEPAKEETDKKPKAKKAPAKKKAE